MKALKALVTTRMEVNMRNRMNLQLFEDGGGAGSGNQGGNAGGGDGKERNSKSR